MTASTSLPLDARPIRAGLANLAWRQWTALGVTGWTIEEPRPVDPEALLVLTARLGDTDARLRDCATDWCVAFGSYINEARLRKVLAQIGGGDPKVDQFFATVAANRGPSWPHSSGSEPRPYANRHKAYLPHLQSSGRLLLRLRALLGVTARAEIVATLVGRTEPIPIIEIVRRTVQTRTAIDNALHQLALAGVVTIVQISPRDTRVLLSKSSSFSDLVQNVPVMPDWLAAFNVALRVVGFAEASAGMPTAAIGTEARRTLREVEPLASAAGIRLPQEGLVGDDFVTAFYEWADGLPDALAGPGPQELAGN
jgi:hypothetical protein